MTNYKSYELLAHYNKYGANDSTIVDEILAHGDLDFQIPSSLPYEGASLKGCTALHVALRREDYDVFQLLINSGADFIVKNGRKATVAHQAIEKDMARYRKFIDSLLSAHLNFNVTKNPHDGNGISHFHVACMMDRVDAVEMFLNNGVALDEAVHLDSNTFAGYAALHFAAQYCCSQTAKTLLDRGASLSVKDARGRTPLHLLISRRISILDRRHMGKRAEWGKFKAELEANAQMIGLFLKKQMIESDDFRDESKLSYFHVACAFEETSRVAELLERSVDLEHRVAANSPLWPGYTALHFAARCSPETVVLLLKNGADFLANDASGVTPLELCLQRFEAEHLHRFVSLEPALRNVVFSDGTTRLTDAILAMKNEKTLSDFIDKIADINIALQSCLWSGYTLLHLATMLPERSGRYSALGEIIRTHPSGQFENLYNCSEESEALYLNRIKMCLKRGASIDFRGAHDSTPLHLAFRLRKESAVECLLESHELLENIVDRDNLSHLCIACAAGNETAVESLLSKSIDHVNLAITSKFECPTTVVDEKPVDFGISAGATPLHVAVSTGNEKIVDLLMNHEADRYARDANGMTPIHYALVQGFRDEENCQIFRELASVLLLSDDLMECPTSFGLTHLHVACYANNVAAIEELLTNGANIEATICSSDRSLGNLLDEELKVLKIADGLTPLHFALKYDCKEAIVALVRSGANFLAVPPKVGFELHEKHSDFLAATLVSDLVSQEIIKRRFGLTELHAACARLDFDRIRELLNEGENVDTQVREDAPLWAGNTPLHFALMKRENYRWDDISSIVKILSDRGADITLTNSSGDTGLFNALYRARESSGAFQFPIFLLDNHRDFKINPINNEGWSHFHLACFCNHAAVVKKFLKCGVCVDQPIDFMFDNYGGYTPIHIAASRKCNRTVELLLKYGVNIQMRTLSGRTPFHEAVNCEDYEDYSIPIESGSGKAAFPSLLKAQADQTSLTPKGESPFEIFLKSHRFTSEYRGINYNKGSINLFNPLTGEGYIAMALSRETDVNKISENLIYLSLITSPEKHVPDKMGRTTIHNVVSIWRSETPYAVYMSVIEQLIKLNFHVDQQDLKGRTALHSATKFRNWRAISALLAVGSDINISDIDCETPVSYLWKFCETHDFRFEAIEQEDRLLCNVMFSHIFKLLRADIHVSKINNQIYTSLINTFHWSFAETEELEDEMTKLKSTNLDSPQISLWNFLPETCLISSYPSMIKWKRHAIHNYFKNNTALFSQEYPQFSGLLRLQYRKAVNRLALLDRAKCSFNFLTEYKLPDLCCDIIFAYLYNEDLENLIDMSSLKIRCDPGTAIDHWTCPNFFSIERCEELDDFERTLVRPISCFSILSYLFPHLSKRYPILIKILVVELYAAFFSLCLFIYMLLSPIIR